MRPRKQASRCDISCAWKAHPPQALALPPGQPQARKSLRCIHPFAPGKARIAPLLLLELFMLPPQGVEFRLWSFCLRLRMQSDQTRLWQSWPLSKRRPPAGLVKPMCGAPARLGCLSQAREPAVGWHRAGDWGLSSRQTAKLKTAAKERHSTRTMLNGTCRAHHARRPCTAALLLRQPFLQLAMPRVRNFDDVARRTQENAEGCCAAEEEG